MTNFRKGFHTTLIFLALLAGCEKPAKEASTPKPDPVDKDFRKQTTLLWDSASTSINTSLRHATNLQNAVNSFLASPASETLSNAQAHWKRAAIAYANFYFFSELSVIEPELFQLLRKSDFRIAAQPIQPGYLDAFGPYPYSGLVNDIGIEISTESLSDQHGLTDESDICLGLYPMEYMLFGESNSRDQTSYLLPKELSREQMVAGFRTLEETPTYRRRQMLDAQAKILSQDLNALAKLVQAGGAIDVTVWQGLTGNRQEAIIKAALERSLTQILVQVIEKQKQENQKQIPTQEELNYQNGYVFSPQEKAKILSQKLRSTLIAKEFLDKPKVFQHAETANKALLLYAEDVNAPLPWEAAYDEIKQATDLLTQQ